MLFCHLQKLFKVLSAWWEIFRSSCQHKYKSAVILLLDLFGF